MCSNDNEYWHINKITSAQFFLFCQFTITNQKGLDGQNKKNRFYDKFVLVVNSYSSSHPNSIELEDENYKNSISSSKRN